MPDLVAPNQAGFIKGRQAADVAQVLRSILAHAAEHHVDGALVFLDQEKAYDRISHDYLLAVLDCFGFPRQLQHAFAATYADTFTYLLDDGHPVGPVSVVCGVCQGDPLAPLLFNLAFEPPGGATSASSWYTLPWDQYHNTAFADDSGCGVAPTDGPSLLQTLDQYCTVSNARINFEKSTFFPLSSTAPIPAWVSSVGLRVHDTSSPIRVLGYDLALNPSGVQEDWLALSHQCEAVSRQITSRHISLQGRALLITSLLSSKLWYKCRLSSPNNQQLAFFRNLAWSTLWNDHTALAPSKLIGRRPRLSGGLNFLAPDAQIPALQAQWIQRFFTRQFLWSPILAHFLLQLSGNAATLASPVPLRIRRRFPDSWRFAIEAWNRLQPHWNSDPSTWSISDALNYPLPESRSSQFPSGVILAQVMLINPGTGRFHLMPETQIRVAFCCSAPQRGWEGVPCPFVDTAPLRQSRY
jgi:hypothetical protein